MLHDHGIPMYTYNGNTYIRCACMFHGTVNRYHMYVIDMIIPYVEYLLCLEYSKLATGFAL